MKSNVILKLLVITLFITLHSCSSKDEIQDQIPDDDSTSVTPDASADSNQMKSLDIYNGTFIFKFSENYEVGQFANGDYWVHNNGADVNIEQILPESTITNTQRVINGTMINPEESNSQGYDSEPRDMKFKASLNVDPGYTSTALIVKSGSSIVKSISTESNRGRPIIQHAVVVTVLDKAPPKGAFRPPYTGSDKSIIATVNDLNYDVLGKHPKLGNEPDILDVQENYERVWLEHCTEWVQRDIHPKSNMPTYGRDIAKKSGEGLITLQLDYSDKEKELLLIRMVQYGLDIYGVAKNGGEWYNNGGHNLGRKMPLLLAAKVLNNTDMLAYADKEKHFIFQDDQQHFYVSQAEVDLTNGPKWDPDDRAPLTPYKPEDIGMAEWGIRHADRPKADNANWSATYRHVNGPAQFSHILAAKLMGVEKEWNWSPAFDYAKRYYGIEKQKKIDGYVLDLWEAYAND
ncbi:hypothetical protein [Tenacibaculum agarivorans]|uniref:hypothetical protein n=1 Tax=Tenacibaculum agarivorans TaxID=1908389 RepID=UPI00094B9E91|nr:hypothetical protein [Tenacibaculum agarivorans]